jgi:hypothetical protein
MRATGAIGVRRSRGTCSGRRRGLGAAPRRVEMGLTPQAVEQVAQRVAQLLGERDSHRQPELLTAGELAHELRVERAWVYKNAHLLGGERLGHGPKAPWRFDPEVAKREMARQRAVNQTGGAL